MALQKRTNRPAAGVVSDKRRALRLRGLGLLLLLLSGLAAGYLPNGLRASAQDGAGGAGQRGSRGAGVRPKKPTTSAARGAAQKGPRAASQSALKSGGAEKSGLTALMGEALSPVLASADFDLVGLAVTANPATQTVPKNTPTAVLTSVRVPEGGDPSAIIAGLSPSLRVRGELTGPSLGGPLSLEAPIGQPLPIPPLNQAGEHLVQNLRVVDVSAAGESVVAPVLPDACGIVVIERLLVSEVRVNELTYEQIVQAGINLTNESYRAFNFTLGLGTTSNAQFINIPVAFPPLGVNPPLPVVGMPTSTAPGVDVPTIVPVMLSVPLTDEGGNATRPELPAIGNEPVRIPGVIVFPGRVGFLNQFFEAIVIVSNGAPDGTPLVLRNLRARAKLPNAGTPADASDDPLRIAETQTGGRITELDLHGLGADGRYGTADDATSFRPGESGQATFLLEGLKEGMHTVNFELEATLDGLPSGPVRVVGEVPGSVLVRDASFAVTFTHPNVVRAGQEYDLAMTLYNTGSRDIQGAFAQLARQSISGAELLGQDTGGRQFTTTIKRKDQATIKWRLRANTTGEVTASYVKVGDDVSAGLALVTGVGDRGVPLSPDSLILPDPVRHLPPGVVEAARAVLGQGWSIANAPPGSLPQGVMPMTKQSVVDRAVELGLAGMRVDFGEPVSVSLDTLLRDWLGELKQDDGFSDALRHTPAGEDFFDAVGAEIYKQLDPSAASPTTPVAFHQEFANAESPRSPFVSALLTHASGEPLAGVRLVNTQGEQVGFGASPDERAGAVYAGASMRLSKTDVITGAVNEMGQMVLASNPGTENMTLEIHGWRTGTADLSLLVPGPSRTYRHVVFSGVHIEAGQKYRVVFRPSGSTTTTPVLELFANGSYAPAATQGTQATLSQPAPRLVGAIQVTPEVVAGGDKYGRLVGLLFSKPMLREQATAAAKYTVGGGKLKNSDEMVGGPVRVKGATLDYGDRFVFLSLDMPIGPYIERDVTVGGVSDARRTPLSPSPTTMRIGARVSPRGVPPGAYLTGRVLNADGTPVVGASVVYWTQECPNPALLVLPPPPTPIAVRVTDAQGRYAMDYVRDGDCAPLSVTVTNPATQSEKRLTTPVAYDGQHLVFDMVFLARGNVRGTVKSGTRVVPNAFVSIIPSLDVVGAQVVRTDADGNYSATGVPVGHVSITAVGTGEFAIASGLAAGTIPGPNMTATVNVSMQNTSGEISGRVQRADGSHGVGALVVAYATIPGFGNINRLDGKIAAGYAYADAEGRFRILNIPLSDVSLEVTDYVTGLRVSRPVTLTPQAPVASGLLLTLPGNGSVSGRVLDETGSPVADAVVMAAGQGVKTDAAGNYVLRNLPAGRHDVRARHPETGQSGSAAATVAIGQTTEGINVVILRPASVQGRVFILEEGSTTPKPAAGAYVSSDGSDIVQADAQGNYKLNAVSPNVPLHIRYVHAQKGLGVVMSVVLSAGETLTRDATFKPGTIRGRVTQPDGVTGTIADLNVFSPRPSLNPGPDFGFLSTEFPRTTRSNADGTYTLTGNNPGQFRVSTSNVFFPTPVSAGGTLAPGGVAECNLSLVSTLAGKIQGRVFQPDGTTPVGQNVRVTLGGGSLADATVRTDEEGRYVFGEVFSAGGYHLTATDPLTGSSNRISVSVQRNQDAVFDIRLLGSGSLKVRVVDGGGNPVRSGSVTLNGSDYPRASRYAEITPESGGVIEFNNLPEGAYAVAATERGLGGRVSVNVAPGSSVETTIQLQASGTVEGRVFMPGGSVPIGLADVELRAGGRSIGFSVTTDVEGDADATGRFKFLNVPAGDFQLDVFDNRTGRSGRSAGRINVQDETATVNVYLLAAGAVTGRVTSNGLPVDHALVEINADGSGVRGARLKATTDDDGRYRFTGIPAGRFTVNVTDAPGGQAGSVSGIVAGTTEPLPDTVANIELEPTQTVTGTVYKLGGTEPMPGALVTLRVNGGRVYRATANEAGVYRLSFVALGQVVARAEAPAGYDRGEGSPVTGTQPGGTVTADVTLDGVGRVAGVATDNNGVPLAVGNISFTNNAWGSVLQFNTSVRADGSYEFKDIPAGAFTLKLSVPGRVGVGSGAGAVVANQTVDVPLKLEDAGRVTGRIISEASGTPVTGVDITLTLWRQSGGSLVFYAHSDSQGLWAFENIPLGAVFISVVDPTTGGIARANNLPLAANAQVIDLGDLRLDSVPIRVESVTPPDAATGLSPTNFTATVNFSEPAQPGTVTAGTLRLARGTSGVSATVTLAADGRSATLKAAGRLADTTPYTVSVTKGVQDLAGNAMAADFSSGFTTKDETGPVVVSVNPSNNATDVPVAGAIEVTFDEPLDAAQDLSNVLQVVVDASNAAAPGSVALDATGRVATFTPSAALAVSTRYRLNAAGQRDALGNVQPNAFTSRFTTFNPPPAVELTAPAEGAQLIEGQTVELAASATDNGSVSRVVFEANGSALTADTSAPYAKSYTVPTGVSSLTVRATATDNENKTATAERVFAVVPDPLTTVNGRVVDNAGQPIAGASVSLAGQPAAQSDAEGNFSITGVATVKGDLVLTAAITVDGREYVSLPKTVAPVAGGTTAAGDILIQMMRYEFRLGALSALDGNNVNFDLSTAVPLPFPFTYYGQTYTEVHLSSNGYLTFGQGDTQSQESVNAFALGAPRIAPLFDDWGGPGPGPEGVYVNLDIEGRVVFTWRRVLNRAGSSLVASFQTILFADGRIQFGYNGVQQPQGGLVGISPGGPTAAAHAYDFSTTPGIDTGVNGAPYQQFFNTTNGVKFDLDHHFILFTPQAGGGYAVSVQRPHSDQTPPSVAHVAPADGTQQVPLNGSVAVTFDEPLAPAQNFAEALRVYPDPTLAAPAAGTYALDAAGRVLTFTPAAPLADGTLYRVLVVGQRDLVGNEQPLKTFSSFVTSDTTGPRINGFTINGQAAVDGMTVGTVLRPVFSASYQDASGVNVAQTRLLLTVPSGTPSQVAAQVGPGALTYQPASNLAFGTYTAEVVVTDAYGNTSSTGPVRFSIVPEAPNVVSVSQWWANRYGNTLLTLKGQRLLNVEQLPEQETGTGLTGEYYNESNYNDPNTFFNFLRRTQTDATINFDWGGGAPLCCVPYPPVGYDNFMVRWTGQVKPLHSETYTFYTVSDDGIRLWVNGQLVIDSWIPQAPTEHSGTITLEAGRKYDIKVEYYEAGGGAVARLLWSSPSQPKQVVPQSQLFPSRVKAPRVFVNGVEAQVMGAAAASPTQDQVAFIAPGGPLGQATVEVRTDHGSGFLPSGNFGYYDSYPVPTFFDPTIDQTVAPTAKIRVGYDQPIDPNFNLQQIIRVYSAACGEGCARTFVAGTVSLDPTGRVGIFTPAQPLPEGRTFYMETRGFKSVNGLTWGGYWWIRFFVADVTPPTVGDWKLNFQSNVNGATIVGGRPTFTNNYSDAGTGLNLASAAVILDGVQQTSGYSFSTSTMSFTPPAPLAEGAHTLTLRIADNAGNVTERTASFTVDPTLEVTSMTPSAGSRHGGQIIEFRGRGLVNSNGTRPTVLIGGLAATTDVNNREYLPFDACTAAQTSAGTCFSLRTPSGWPGNATVQIVTDHGTLTVAGGFTYDNDQQMPFEIESDTVLLWDFAWDESDVWTESTYPGGIWSYDYGPRALDVSDIFNEPNGYETTRAPSRGLLHDGRFYEGGVTDFAIVAVEDYGALGFGERGFTVEAWAKTDPSRPLTRTHTLFGKENVRGQNTDFALSVLPSGQLRAHLYNAAGAVWEATTDTSALNMNDGQWHSLAMVVERGAQEAQNRLVIYADGEARASAPMPEGFGAMRDAGERFRIGHSDADGPGDTTKSYFPGFMDEVRISSTARSAETIGRTYNGASQLGMVAIGTNVWFAHPNVNAIRRGTTMELFVTGYNLFGATPAVTALDGTPLPVTAEVRVSTQTYTLVRFTSDAFAPLGDALLKLSVGDRSVNVPVRIVDQQPFTSGPSTLLLWHLDSPLGNNVSILDSGPRGIGGTSLRTDNSAARFGFGAGRDVLLTGAPDNGVLNFGESSFSVQFWLKTDQRYEKGTYTLVGREDAQGRNSDFSLSLLPTHDLRAQVYNAAGGVWEVIMPGPAGDVADFRWHLVTLVVDRAAGKMSIFVDGTERASGPAPADFGAARYTPTNLFRAGHLDLDGPSDTLVWGPDTKMFGYMDELRVLNVALTPAQVLNNWLGVSTQQDASLKDGGSPSKAAQRGVALTPPANVAPGEVARGRLPKRSPSRPEPPQRDPEASAEPPAVNPAEHSRGGGQRR